MHPTDKIIFFLSGRRFSKLPTYAAILTIFKNYRIELSKDKSTKLDFKPTALVTQPVSDIYFEFIPRHESKAY